MKFKIVALATLVGFSALSVQANELPNEPRIMTSGTASADTTPDITTLAIEVGVAAKDAVSAKKQTDERVARYLPFLERNQTAKKDVSAANLHTQPDYDYQSGKSVLKDYRTVRTAEITLRQLDELSALLDGALEASLNEVRSVSLSVTQPDTCKDKARKVAINDAIHQAEQLTAGFNSKLGPVYNVRYHISNYQPSPMVRMMKTGAAPATSTQEAYKQPVIQFDDQADVVLQIEPTAGQPTATPAKTQ